MAAMVKPGLTVNPPDPTPYDNVSDWQEPSYMEDLGAPPMDFAGIVEYNNRAAAAAAAVERDYSTWSANYAMNFEAYQNQLNRDFQQASAREAMAFEAEQAEINREFQKNLRDTAYQAAVEDMRKAGINPILAYTQGGAAVTNGAIASGHSSSGSTARGYAASGSRASVDMNTTADILKQVINSATSIGNNVLNIGSSFVREIGSLIAKLKG